MTANVRRIVETINGKFRNKTGAVTFLIFDNFSLRHLQQNIRINTEEKILSFH